MDGFSTYGAATWGRADHWPVPDRAGRRAAAVARLLAPCLGDIERAVPLVPVVQAHLERNRGLRGKIGAVCARWSPATSLTGAGCEW